MLRYCARNGNNHPRRGPRGDRPFSDQVHEVFREGAVKRQPAGDPPLGASHEKGDPLLREVVVITEFPYEGRLLDGIPLSPVGPGEDLREGLFLRAVPDFHPHCVAPAVLQGPYSEISIEQHKGFCRDHGDELANSVDGCGQGEALFGPVDSCAGIAENELCNLDLSNLPKYVHEEELSRGSKIWSISSCIIVYPYPGAANVRTPTLRRTISSCIMSFFFAGIRMTSSTYGFFDGLSSCII